MARDGLARFFLGLGVGVGIGMLLSPRSGDKTRDLIKEKADEGKEYLTRRSSELLDGATDIIESGKEAIGRKKDALAAAVAAGKRVYGEAGGQPAPTEGSAVA
jgi:gas vesicle protein